MFLLNNKTQNSEKFMLKIKKKIFFYEIAIIHVRNQKLAINSESK